MIPVAMGEQQAIPGNLFFKQKVSQPPNAGAGIDNHGFSGFGSDLNAGRIPAVSDVLTARHRY
jgi:hypothetical protein